MKRWGVSELSAFQRNRANCIKCWFWQELSQSGESPTSEPPLIMASAAREAAPVVVTFPTSTTMKDFDSEFQNSFLDQRRVPDLIVDMSGVRFLLVECLPALAAELEIRNRLKLRTVIRLPVAPDTRAIIRRWAFAKAMQEMKLPLSRLVDPNDKKYFQGRGGDSDTHEYGMDKYVLRGKVVSVPRPTNRFDELRHWDVESCIVVDDPNRFQRAVVNECDRWCFDTVMPSLLERHLGPHYGCVWTHIIHEAMSNAFRHGAAKSLLSTSKADFDKVSGKDRALMLAFWDDGVPLHETLSAALKKNGSIAGSAYTQSKPLRYEKKTKPRGATSYVREIVDSKSLPTADSAMHEFLLSTLYPGITADVSGRQHIVHPALAAQSGADALPGMGLANLINGAVDILGGKVTFRAGAYFMSVKKAKSIKTADYSVKIEERWPFNGNMVVVRLPIR